MLDCSKCKWSNPETCRICKAEQKEKELEQKIQGVVGELVATKQVELEPMETDPNWWELHLIFHKN